jgi:hypothetical protein
MSELAIYHSPRLSTTFTSEPLRNRDYPFIDYGTGGSIDGQIRAAEANIAKSDR